MKLLLAVDQSKDSNIAINLVRQFQWPAGSSLLLLHVTTNEEKKRLASLTPTTSKKSGSTGKPLSTIQSEFHRVEKLLASKTLKVESMVVSGIPGQEILTTIRRRKIDLVVLGSRGLSRVSGLLMGSVSEWVLNDASCSVLIGRPTARKAKSSLGLNVILAIDGSLDARNAVDVLKELRFPARTIITVLHVLRKHMYETKQIVRSAGKSRAEFSKNVKNILPNRAHVVMRLLQEARRTLTHVSRNIEEYVALGHEAQEIINAARQQKADLVIMGSKGMTGLRRFLMGSVAQTVSQHAPCSVLIVRSSKKTEIG